jgi:hypothetical protein
LAAITASLTAFVVIFCGAFMGVWLRSRLPDHHLDEDTRDVVRLGTGLVGTVAALVLGLLVASAKNAYDTQSSQVTSLTANIILLDQLLARYGPEARESRELLRQAIDPMIQRIWRDDRTSTSKGLPFEIGFSATARILELAPQTEAQHFIKATAIQLSTETAKTRLLLFVEAGTRLPLLFLVVLIFWLTILFASFSLFVSLNPTLIAALCVCAVAASCAIYLILDLGQPFWGLMQISSLPLRHALAPLEP